MPGLDGSRPAVEAVELTGVVVGAGDRGYDAYTRLFLDDPSAGRVVAVAEPDPTRTARFAARYGLRPSQCHQSWEDLFAQPRLADFALVATGDRHHVEPTLAALAAGYHVLLEKPMALDEADCERLIDAADAAGRVLAVCHVYRWSHLFSRLHHLIEAGELGDVVSIQQSENVAYWHYAHSYVRGLTRSSEVPWLLQKSCHDLDLITWMAGAPPAAVSSFIRPTELTETNAPDGAPEHCIEGCPHAPECPYDAVATYRDLEPVLGDLAMTRRPVGLGPLARVARRVRPMLAEAPLESVRARVEWWRWPVAAVTDDHTPQGLEHALRTTRSGACAYRVGDNDQPSAQTVAIRYANGVVANFTLQSNSYRSMRSVPRRRYPGHRGRRAARARWDPRGPRPQVGAQPTVAIPPAYDGHGGGERPLFEDFLAAIRSGREPRCSQRASLDSHRIAFAAMRAAHEGIVIELDGDFSG